MATLHLFPTQILGYNLFFNFSLPLPPHSSSKIVLIAITKHSASQVKNLATKLPQADALVSEKFESLLAAINNNIKVKL